MEVPAKRKSLHIHQCGILHDLPIVKECRDASCLLLYTGEKLYCCSVPYVRKELISFKDSQGALASHGF